MSLGQKKGAEGLNPRTLLDEIESGPENAVIGIDMDPDSFGSRPALTASVLLESLAAAMRDFGGGREWQLVRATPQRLEFEQVREPERHDPSHSVRVTELDRDTNHNEQEPGRG